MLDMMSMYIRLHSTNLKWFASTVCKWYWPAGKLQAQCIRDVLVWMHFHPLYLVTARGIVVGVCVYSENHCLHLEIQKPMIFYLRVNPQWPWFAGQTGNVNPSHMVWVVCYWWFYSIHYVPQLQDELVGLTDDRQLSYNTVTSTSNPNILHHRVTQLWHWFSDSAW